MKPKKSTFLGFKSQISKAYYISLSTFRIDKAHENRKSFRGNRSRMYDAAHWENLNSMDIALYPGISGPLILLQLL
jgi:hypothetical protein